MRKAMVRSCLARMLTVTVLLAALLAGAVHAQPARADTSSCTTQIPKLSPGQVVLGSGLHDGTFYVYNNSGSLIDFGHTCGLGDLTTGMAFGSNGMFLMSEFSGDTISAFEPSSGRYLGPFGYTDPGKTWFSCSPESIAVGPPDNQSYTRGNNRAGDIFVGQADCLKYLLEFTPDGKFKSAYAPETENRGVDWVAADPRNPCLIYYTSEGVRILRFDVCGRGQQSDFVSDLDSDQLASGGPCARPPNSPVVPNCVAYAMKFLPDGGMLVADSQRVVRLDSAGLRVQEYDLYQHQLYGLDLDPDGTSFWTSDVATGEMLKVDIGSGAILASVHSLSGASGGLAVVPKTTIEATGIEVTQVAQNVDNADLLVANKETYAIVRARTLGGNVPAVGVTARLINDATGASANPLPNWARVTLIGNPGRDTSLHSFVFQLDPSWTQAGTLHLTAEINPDSSYPGPIHSIDATATFTAAPIHLNVRLINLSYSSTLGGRIASPVIERGNGTEEEVRLPLQNSYPVPEGGVSMMPASLAIRLPFDAMSLTGPDGKPVAENCTRTIGYLEGLVKDHHLTVPSQGILYAVMPYVPQVGSVYGDGSAEGFYSGCASKNFPIATGVGPIPGSMETFRHTTVHEVGHLLGFRHVNQIGCSGNNRIGKINPDYPDLIVGTIGNGSIHKPSTGGTYEDVGFDPFNLWTPDPSDPVLPGTYGDIMTYCEQQGMSDYTYEKSMALIPALHAGGGVGTFDIAGTADALMVAGSINYVYETASFSGVTTGHETGNFPADQPGPYHIRFFDSSGGLLADHPFLPASATDDMAGPQGNSGQVGTFAEVVSLPIGARRVAIYSDRAGREIASRTISASAPSVTLASPTSGATLPASGPIAVAWNGADAGGTPLTYSVTESSDGGATWQPLADDVSDTSVQVDAAELAGAQGNGIIRVIASDGANTGYADITGLTIPSKAPTVSIDGPAAGTTVSTLAAVALHGSASDLQTGTLPDSDLSWSSDRDGLLGTGESVIASNLSLGTHVITLTATNASGQTSTATTTVTVGPDTPPAATLHVNPSELTVAYDGTTSGTITHSLDVDNLGTGNLTWTASSDSPRVTLVNSAGAPPEKLWFTTDTSGLPAGADVVAHITVTANGSASSPQQVTMRLESTKSAVTLSAQQIGFGAQVVGGAPISRTETLTNAGADSVPLGTSTLTGGTPGDFSLAADTCSGATIPAGGSCSISVSFSPGAAGERSAYLTIPSVNPWHIPLDGSGTVVPVSAGTTVVAWGDNNSGQAGADAGSTQCGFGYICAPTPVTVPGLANVSSISAGASHDLALESDGSVWAWGANRRGQLGLGTTDTLNHTTPQRIPALSNVTAIAAGDAYSLALTADGTVWGWGQDSGGNINGCFCNVLTPVPVLDHATAIAVGTQPGSNNLISYALRTDGTVWQWGDYGDFGSAPHSPHPIPSPDGTGSLSGIVAIAHRMALKSDGTVWTWGDGSSGQLGNGTRPLVSDTPVQVLAATGVAPLGHVVAISAWSNQRYAVRDDGTTLAWGGGTASSASGTDYTIGASDNVALGIGTASSTNGFALPVPVTAPAGSGPLSSVAAVTPGLALRADGSAFAWGQALIGQLGNGTNLYNPWTPGNNDGSATPVQVQGVGGTGVLGSVSTVSGAYAHLAIVGGAPPTGSTAPPTATGAPDRTPDSNGWYNHPVTINWTSPSNTSSCDDATNYAGGDGSAITVVGYCSNSASRTASASVTLNYDATPPTTTATVSGTTHNPGYLPPVTVTLVASDNASGVANTYYTLDGDPTIHDYGAPIVFTTPGYHHVTYWSEDQAGNVEPHADDAHSLWILVVAASGPLDHLVLNPASGSVQVGAPQTFTAEGFDAAGDDLGEVTDDARFSIAPDGSCIGATCTPATVGPHTVTAVVDGITGTATLAATAIPVTIKDITLSPIAPDTQVEFSDTATISATLTAASTCCGPLNGTLTLTVNGQPMPGVSAPVSTATGTATITAQIPLGNATIPAGAGTYPVSAVFTSTNANYANANGSANAVVVPEGGTLTYTGDYFTQDTKAPTVSVLVDQRDPQADPVSIDYGATPVWVRFDVYPSNSATPTQTLWSRVANASDWTTSGRGTASATLSSALPDGSYRVTANLVASGSAAIGQTNPYLQGDETVTTLTSSPPTGAFVTGGGYITPDSQSNTSNTHANFGFNAKYDKTLSHLQGNLDYIYRINMDVGGGNYRDVDVHVKSTAMTYLGVNISTAPATAVLTGTFSIQCVDAITGSDYTPLDFDNGTYQLNVTDAGPGGSADAYGIALRRPDGTLFYASTAPYSTMTGAATQIQLGGGDITVHP